MFQPPLFREDRIDVMQMLMREHPFAMVLSSPSGRLSADHVPLVVHPEFPDYGILRGHLAAGNPLWRDSKGDIKVLAVFQGPQAYISPAWYPSKNEHGRAVPTWNYAVVHAHGTLRFTQDLDWLMQHLTELTRRHENRRPSPWAVTDAPEDFLARQLRGLVGFEVKIEALSGQWKTSQNKNRSDREGVEAGLSAERTEQARVMSELVRCCAR